MPIEMPKGLPFSVDTWIPQSRRKHHHFLTHAHTDHLVGIASHFSYPIYATSITKSLVLRNFQQVEERVFVEIEVGRRIVVKDPDGDFTVTAFDANHCPGAVMFLFKGEFGNILHTGDCRLTDDFLPHLPNLCHLDYLFLDCTFGQCSLKIPSKQSSIQQVINCIGEHIQKHRNAPVYLACDMLGQEEILVQISRAFKSKIYVDSKIHWKCFHSLSLVAPEIISEDVAASRFQVIKGYPRLHEIVAQKLAEPWANRQSEPLFIRTSAQWYAKGNQSEVTQAVQDKFGICRVCYSMHSSREELERALNLLQPKVVISTTPHCPAMEFDFDMKHCDETHMTGDDQRCNPQSRPCMRKEDVVGENSRWAALRQHSRDSRRGREGGKHSRHRSLSSDGRCNAIVERTKRRSPIKDTRVRSRKGKEIQMQSRKRCLEVDSVSSSSEDTQLGQWKKFEAPVKKEKYLLRSKMKQQQKRPNTDLLTFKCFSCGGLGHLLKDCPESPKCFNCNMHGHFANKCPNTDLSTFKCFSCGGLGHLQKDCTESPTCFNCNLCGHFANKCPDKAA